jgi:hypothetical protein
MDAKYSSCSCISTILQHEKLTVIPMAECLRSGELCKVSFLKRRFAQSSTRTESPYMATDGIEKKEEQY